MILVWSGQWSVRGGRGRIRVSSEELITSEETLNTRVTSHNTRDIFRYRHLLLVCGFIIAQLVRCYSNNKREMEIKCSEMGIF